MQKDSASTKPSARIIDISNSDAMSHNNNHYRSVDVTCDTPQKTALTNAEESVHSDVRIESDDDSLQETFNEVSSNRV